MRYLMACLLIFLVSQKVLAQSSRTRTGETSAIYNTEGQQAVQQLNEILAQLVQVENMVERMDLPRLFLMRQRCQQVLESIKARGLSHMGTIREYQTLIVTFRYSSAYLQRIRTGQTGASLDQIVTTINAIVQARGFDDSPYTQITVSTFSQVRQLLLELVQGTSSTQLHQQVAQLMPLFGVVIAKGGEGDRPETFKVAVELYQKVKLLYPLLHSLGGKGERFNIILNIQALVEFYGEYAQRKD